MKYCWECGRLRPNVRSWVPICESCAELCSFDSERPIWDKAYPDVKGKNVLDLGAHCGDCINYWFSRGAAHVIAIDKAHMVPVPANTTPIEIELGAIKIDIEGSEKGMVIETHFPNPRLELLHDWGNGVRIYRLTGD